MATTPAEIARWRDWLRIINAEVVGLYHDRHLFMEIMQMISSNPDLPKTSVVYEWIVNAYVASATAGVRRQLDPRTDTISFRRLLTEIIASPTVIARAWFVAEYTSPAGGWADRDFDKFAPGGAPHIDQASVQADLDRLLATGEAVREFTNKYVAHRDELIALKKVSNAPILKWEGLHAAIDLLGNMLMKYELLLNQRGMTQVEPVIQEDWEDVFRVAWLVRQA